MAGVLLAADLYPHSILPLALTGMFKGMCTHYMMSIVYTVYTYISMHLYRKV